MSMWIIVISLLEWFHSTLLNYFLTVIYSGSVVLISVQQAKYFDHVVTKGAVTSRSKQNGPPSKLQLSQPRMTKQSLCRFCISSWNSNVLVFRAKKGRESDITPIAQYLFLVKCDENGTSVAQKRRLLVFLFVLWHLCLNLYRNAQQSKSLCIRPAEIQPSSSSNWALKESHQQPLAQTDVTNLPRQQSVCSCWTHRHQSIRLIQLIGLLCCTTWALASVWAKGD